LLKPGTQGFLTKGLVMDRLLYFIRDTLWPWLICFGIGLACGLLLSPERQKPVQPFDSYKVEKALELIHNYDRQQGYRLEPEEERKLVDYLLYLVRRNPDISVEDLYNRYKRNAVP
jgi:hypothetical protein